MRGQSPELPRRPCTGPAVWRGRDLAASRAWALHLSPARLDELDAAVRTVRARGTPLLKVTAGDFPLPTLAGELRRAADELENGRGFVLVRGIPVERHSEEAAGVLLWGVGQHLGIPVSQDATGHMLTHLRDAPDARAALSPRTEAADALALLCLRAGGSSGRTTLAGSAAVHNAVLARRPELLDGLSRTHFLDRRGEQLPGQLPWLAVPLAHRDGERLSLRYDRDRLESAQRFPEVPRLSPADRELFDLMDEAASSPKLRLDIDLAPGDLLLLNNHAVLHACAPHDEYGPQRERPRHLLQLWLTPHQSRLLPAEFWGDENSGPGGRGGVTPRDVITPHTPHTPHTPTKGKQPHVRPLRTPGALGAVPR
ncbi:TauD/TfdA family dioxygenase [Streptomyces sp. NPDC005480]|uniref:TauD/TfdA family dioxygenase n=1 Tax=Streptomyces sp. NPDC005480 TaxID=3154880 RepID=UPI0033B46DA3